MNFTPFTGHIPSASALPTLHQFAAKFGYETNGTATATGVVQETRYQGTHNVQFAVAPSVSVDGPKFRPADSVVVVSAAQPSGVTLTGITPIHAVNTGVKYQTISASTSSVNLGNVCYGTGPSAQAQAQFVPEGKERAQRRDDCEIMLQQASTSSVNLGNTPPSAQAQAQAQFVPEGKERAQRRDDCEIMLQQVAQATPLQQGQQLVVLVHEPRREDALGRAVKQESTAPIQNEYIIVSSSGLGDISDSSWQLTTGVPDYLSALPLPLPLHHLLKYSAPAPGQAGGDLKKDEPTIVTLAANTLAQMPVIASAISQSEQTQVQAQSNSVVIQTSSLAQPTPTHNGTNSATAAKKRRKKKPVQEKKERPKPGEIRLTTALDGSTLYCCPECHMAYPERGLLEQHLLGHTMERRFICNICNAALKRKDHLTRHKQSHNPERPHICSVCLKAFKRKEQLTLHFVIHSGEKRHLCNDCGKGFYRKDHLRKHTRSHIARRVKAELSAGNTERSSPPLRAPPAPAPAPQPS